MSERVLLEAHAHTSEVSPCGWLSGVELVRTLHENGYEAAVITDHFSPGSFDTAEKREMFLAGYHAAKAAAEALDMVILPGMEIRFKDRREDFLVYGMEAEDFASLPGDVCDAGLRVFHDLAKEKGWLVYQAHPFRPKMLPANPSDIDGMETFNGNPRHNSQNRLATGFAARHGLRGICGSDVHRPGDAGVVGLLVPRDALTPKGFAAWLRCTPHPRVKHQELPRDGIRYVVGAVPGYDMVQSLYGDAGWTTYTRAMEETLGGIRHSLRVVTAWDDTTLIGLARAVGDGYTILYVQDVLVLGAYQRRGIGRGLVRRLLAPYQHVRQIALITDDSTRTRSFYRSCGFDNIAEIGCAGYVMLR